MAFCIGLTSGLGLRLTEADFRLLRVCIGFRDPDARTPGRNWKKILAEDWRRHRIQHHLGLAF